MTSVKYRPAALRACLGQAAAGLVVEPAALSVVQGVHQGLVGTSLARRSLPAQRAQQLKLLQAWASQGAIGRMPVSHIDLLPEYPGRVCICNMSVAVEDLCLGTQCPASQCREWP